MKNPETSPAKTLPMESPILVPLEFAFRLTSEEVRELVTICDRFD